MEFGDFGALIGLAAALCTFWGVKRLRGLAAVPGWALILVPEFTRWVLRLFGQDFVILATGASPLVPLFNWLTTGAGHFVLMLGGGVWLLVIFRIRNDESQKINPQGEPAGQPIVSRLRQPNLQLQPIETRPIVIGGVEVICLCAPFRNDVDRTADKASHTVAYLNYRGSNIPVGLTIHSGFWEGAEFNNVTIDRAGTERLVLAYFEPGAEECFALGDERDRVERSVGTDHLHGSRLGHGTWSVTVELSAEDYRKAFPEIRFSFSGDRGFGEISVT